ncbi:MAG: hypothetical protein Q7U94_06590 [Sideroxyarcus sp.]|nr:hypothetical protein [Sideroxyarcus sp.]
MDTDQYLNYIRVLRDREDNKGKKAGITTWSLLVALIYVVWQLIPEVPLIKADSVLIAYVVQLYGYMQITAILTIDLFRTSLQPVRRGQFGFRISLFEEKNISLIHLIALLALGLLLPTAGLHYSNEYLGIAYSSWPRIQGAINTFILLPFLLLTVIVFSVLKIYQSKTEYPSPLILVAQGNGANGLNRYIFFPISLLLWIGNAICIYLVIQSLPSDFFSQILRVSLDSMLLILIISALLTSTKIDNTSARLEALERDIVLHELDTHTVRERIQDELLGHEAGEWLRNRVLQVRQKAESVREVTQQALELKKTILEINPEFTHEQFGRVADYTTKLQKLTTEYNGNFESLGKWLIFSIQMIKVYKDTSLENLLNDVHKQLSEVNENIKKDVINAVHEVGVAMSEVNTKRHEMGLPIIALPTWVKQ